MLFIYKKSQTVSITGNVREEIVDISIQESMDLGNGVFLDRGGKFCYLEDMLSRGKKFSIVGKNMFCIGKL